MSRSRLDAARLKLLEACRNEKFTNPAVHTVTFQPLGPTKNADRMAIERWDILGQRWLCLAVCDGHVGCSTSDYTVKTLPGRLKRVLERLVREHYGGRLDRQNYKAAEPVIINMLFDEIVNFDLSLADAIRDICPYPGEYTEQQARKLIQDNLEVVERAFQGTTLSMAIVNLDHHFMWAAGVGDSTIALSTVDSTGERQAERLCELHTLNNRHEFYRVVMSHSAFEGKIVDRDTNKILGWLGMSRAIGDLPLKMHSAYMRYLFQFLPDHGNISRFVDRVVSPPYVIAEPSVRFVDLEPVWGADPILVLHSDGVDSLVEGSVVFSPDVPRKIDPLDVIPSFLPNERFDPRVETLLEHSVEPQWSRDERNMAIDILGNLLGGTNAERLEMVMDKRRLLAKDSSFLIDDVTIIVARLVES
ncbi:protein serine/threonine phosphatase 2C [Cubamyces sp. BRFM 1775]|nr:protein serine/threonine phosphatase 2C [Cubamyces sp. BRFM 1775]